jgi:hypothetical protein
MQSQTKKRIFNYQGCVQMAFPTGRSGWALVIIQRQPPRPLSPSLSPLGKERCFITIPNFLFFHINNNAKPNKEKNFQLSGLCADGLPNGKVGMGISDHSTATPSAPISFSFPVRERAVLHYKSKHFVLPHQQRFKAKQIKV